MSRDSSESGTLTVAVIGGGVELLGDRVGLALNLGVDREVSCPQIIAGPLEAALGALSRTAPLPDRHCKNKLI